MSASKSTKLTALVEVMGHKVPVANVKSRDFDETRRQAMAVCFKKGWGSIASLIQNNPQAVRIEYFGGDSPASQESPSEEKIRARVNAGVPAGGYWQDKYDPE
ncbi:MAG: hypothetical protein NTW50_03670 [Candidatus Berkelbacteria bacterium]|nr:hypothetical protein [Candidatus Berkelbacteria bacterium]